MESQSSVPPASGTTNCRPVLFDLDGVVVDNVGFENDVTRSIIQRLAADRNLSYTAAAGVWNHTLELHRTHARWHDYSYHCEALDLGDFWREAHRSSAHLLKRCIGAVDAMAAARHIGPAWLVSDATEWVVRFKLAVVDIDPAAFSELFTVDRCSTNKGQPEYWRCVKQVMSGAGFTALVYVDNREDRLRVADEVFPAMVGICVDAEDHPVSLGFGEKNGSSTFLHATHESLGSTLTRLAEDR